MKRVTPDYERSKSMPETNNVEVFQGAEYAEIFRILEAKSFHFRGRIA